MYVNKQLMFNIVNEAKIHYLLDFKIELENLKGMNEHENEQRNDMINMKIA